MWITFFACVLSKLLSFEKHIGCVSRDPPTLCLPVSHEHMLTTFQSQWSWKSAVTCSLHRYKGTIKNKKIGVTCLHASKGTMYPYKKTATMNVAMQATPPVPFHPKNAINLLLILGIHGYARMQKTNVTRVTWSMYTKRTITTISVSSKANENYAERW